jgi:hypothetical protein
MMFLFNDTHCIRPIAVARIIRDCPQLMDVHASFHQRGTRIIIIFAHFHRRLRASGECENRCTTICSKTSLYLYLLDLPIMRRNLTLPKTRCRVAIQRFLHLRGYIHKRSAIIVLSGLCRPTSRRRFRDRQQADPICPSFHSTINTHYHERH